VDDELLDRKTAINALIVSRIAFGVAAWLFPRPAARAFGFDMSENQQLPNLARLIGTRDVILAYGLLTTEGDEQTKWLRISLANDGAGTVARHRRGSRQVSAQAPRPPF
jgi:hypothetical protein